MKPRVPFDSDVATRAVVRVGDGRGFVMEIREANPRKDKFFFGGKMVRLRPFISRRVVVTAAHCLPSLPPAHAAAFKEEKTYPLLGLLDGERPSIVTECLFVDPVADLAILGEPDEQMLGEESEAFTELVETAAALPIGSVISSVSGWMLSLDNRWMPCTLEPRHGLWIREAKGQIKGGMSGSPILLNDGSVVGVMATGKGTEGGPQPRLAHALPGWMLAGLGMDAQRKRKIMKKRTEHRT